MNLKFNNLPDILEWIREPSHKEHLYILEAAIAQVKKTGAGNLTVGDNVVFGRPNGRKHYGVVEKLNPAKAVVNCKGAKWRVPYSMLQVA